MFSVWDTANRIFLHSNKKVLCLYLLVLVQIPTQAVDVKSLLLVSVFTLLRVSEWPNSLPAHAAQ